MFVAGRTRSKFDNVAREISAAGGTVETAEVDALGEDVPTPAVESAYQAPRRPIDRVCGAFITTFGIKLMLNRV